jgi:hypothetical protein
MFLSIVRIEVTSGDDSLNNGRPDTFQENLFSCCVRFEVDTTVAYEEYSVLGCSAV